MQASSCIRSASLGLLGSAALALVTTTALAEAPVRSTQVSYANGGGDQNGYSRASVGLNYKFIRCDNEIHLAYSLDNKSVRVSDTYSYNGKEVMAAVPVPTPPTIALSGRVTEGGSTTAIAQVSDGLAAPALGYGCFSGQTKKVGPVPAGSPTDVDAYLSGLIFTPSNMPQLLRNGVVENVQATAERVEQQRLAAEKSKAEQAAAKRTEQARVQAAKVQTAKGAKALADKTQAEAERTREDVPEETSLSSDINGTSSKSRTSIGAVRQAGLTERDVAENDDYRFFVCGYLGATTPIYIVAKRDLTVLDLRVEKDPTERALYQSIAGQQGSNLKLAAEKWMTAAYVSSVQKLMPYKATFHSFAECKVSLTAGMSRRLAEVFQQRAMKERERRSIPWTNPLDSKHRLEILGVVQ